RLPPAGRALGAPVAGARRPAREAPRLGSGGEAPPAGAGPTRLPAPRDLAQPDAPGRLPGGGPRQRPRHPHPGADAGPQPGRPAGVPPAPGYRRELRGPRGGRPDDRRDLRRARPPGERRVVLRVDRRAGAGPPPRKPGAGMPSVGRGSGGGTASGRRACRTPVRGAASGRGAAPRRGGPSPRRRGAAPGPRPRGGEPQLPDRQGGDGAGALAPRALPLTVVVRFLLRVQGVRRTLHGSLPFRLIGLAAVLAWSVSAHATTFVMVQDGDLADQADVIVEGRVAAVA